MKRGRLIVIGLVGLVLALGLSGCIITSASPDPKQIVEIRPGEKVIFKVEGPVNTPISRCVWTVETYLTAPEVVSIGKNEFELNFNADSWMSNKKNIVTCEYQTYVWDPIGVGNSTIYISFECFWITVNSISWEVSINPDSSTVMPGNYYIQNISDLQSLRGYTTVTGSLKIIPIDVNGDLTSLSGLENITSIGGSLIISHNDALTNLSGLQNLASVGGDLAIGGGRSGYNGNVALTELGMSGLQRVNGEFSISYNPLLCTSLAEELMNQVLAGEGIGGTIDISGNKACTMP